EAGLGAELARSINDRIAEIVAKWPERFVGLGTVPLPDAGLGLAELQRCVKRLGLRDIEINGNVNGFELTDKLLGLDKVFAKAEELDVLIFMHPTGFTHGQRLLDHYFNNLFANPFETTVAASTRVLHGG